MCMVMMKIVNNHCPYFMHFSNNSLALRSVTYTWYDEKLITRIVRLLWNDWKSDMPLCWGQMTFLWSPWPTLSLFHIGRTGRAGRTGEAITFYTEADLPFLRNIANSMKSSGCEVPSWIMALPKLKWKKHRPRRDSISTQSRD